MAILANSSEYSTVRLEGVDIIQADRDFKIGKHDIPQGYVYVTGIAKANGKKINNFLRQDSTQRYIKTLSSETRISASALCKALKGTNDLQGTWMHPQLAVELLGWINPEFRLWGNKMLLKILSGQEITQADREEGWGLIASLYQEEQEEIDDRRLPGDDLYYSVGVN